MQDLWAVGDSCAGQVAHSAAPLCKADQKTVRQHPASRLSPAEPARDTLIQAIQFRHYQINHHDRHDPNWIMEMPLQC